MTSDPLCPLACGSAGFFCIGIRHSAQGTRLSFVQFSGYTKKEKNIRIVCELKDFAVRLHNVYVNEIVIHTPQKTQEKRLMPKETKGLVDMHNRITAKQLGDLLRQKSGGLSYASKKQNAIWNQTNLGMNLDLPPPRIAGAVRFINRFQQY